jgi:hypothetical protein
MRRMGGGGGGTTRIGSLRIAGQPVRGPQLGRLRALVLAGGASIRALSGTRLAASREWVFPQAGRVQAGPRTAGHSRVAVASNSQKPGSVQPAGAGPALSLLCHGPFEGVVCRRAALF